MNTDQNKRDSILGDVVDALCDPGSYGPVTHPSPHDMPMPSVERLEEIIELLRAVIFPGYFGVPELKPSTMRFHIGAMLDRVSRLLAEQIKLGTCFACQSDKTISCEECEVKSRSTTGKFLAALPEIRRLLATDVEAAYVGDPAAKTRGEAIYCYPSIRAMTNYRIAHELHELGVELIPRIITEAAHSGYGIDIHPGAKIGERFFTDHGTGVVIGETCEIGRNVRIYQGVTLGAKSFALDEEGHPIKGIPRHPIVEDNVIIYSGATILGRITIGRGSVIGGNVWITSDIPPLSRIILTNPNELPKLPV
jgi:serine O-acetyltransferase